MCPAEGGKRRDGGVSGSGGPAESFGGLPIAPDHGPAGGYPPAEGKAGPVRCRRGIVCRGGVPTGTWLAGASPVPGGYGSCHGADGVAAGVPSVAADGAVFSVGRRAGRSGAGAGAGLRLRSGICRETVSGGDQLASAAGCSAGILCAAASGIPAGGQTWGRRDHGRNHIHRRTESCRAGAARHGKHPEKPRHRTAGTGAGADVAGRASAAGGGTNRDPAGPAGGAHGPTPRHGLGQTVQSAALLQHRSSGGTAAGGLQ